MENILIVLVLIGSLIYKVYSSYKEEMEKAAKRKQQIPPVPQPVQAQQRVPTSAPPHPRPVVPPPIHTPKPIQRTPAVARYEQDVPLEVKRAQQSRIERAHKKIEILEEEKEKQVFEFDLRQAVIQSVILERPYK